MIDMSEDIDIESIVSAVIIGAIQDIEQEKTPQNTGLPGAQYLQELLLSSPQRIYEVLRMKKETFLLLCDWLENNTELKSTWRTSIQEQVAMFLWTINYSASSRQVKERFQHSVETISR
jgi:hypothetical protein